MPNAPLGRTWFGRVPLDRIARVSGTHEQVAETEPVSKQPDNAAGIDSESAASYETGSER